MTDADILRCVEAVDERAKHGGDRKSEKFQETTLSLENQNARLRNEKSSSHKTAEIIGISPRKVEQTRTILDHADEATRRGVLDGKKSINKAYNETQERRKQDIVAIL